MVMKVNSVTFELRYRTNKEIKTMFLLLLIILLFPTVSAKKYNCKKFNNTETEVSFRIISEPMSVIVVTFI